MAITPLPPSPSGQLLHEDIKNKVNEIISRLNQVDTGWASYVDTQYPNMGSSFTLQADTDTLLPNNAGTIIDFQKPEHVPTFYDGSTKTVLGRNGDNLDMMAYFKAVPTIQNQWLDIWVDIGAPVGELYRETKNFPRGAGEERGIKYDLSSAYTLGTWELNGGKIYIRSNAIVQIYAINFNFDISHKAISI